MSMCEYDRNLLKEVRNILYEIRDEMKRCNETNDLALDCNIRRANKQAHIHQEAMRYHLELMKENNEE